MCRAYNDWLRDYCSADTSRLYGVGAVPLQDIPAAIAEMERSLEQLDFKAIFVRPAPYIGLKKLHDPIYDAFWDAAQSLGCPIGVHPYPMADMPNTVQLLALDDDSYGMPSEGLTLRQGLGNAMDMMMATGWFVAGGICERFPNLKVVILEGSGGWMPTMLERFDHQQKVFGNPYQQTPPSEVFLRQCWVSFDPDECALAFAAETLGADRILWASDYPHPGREDRGSRRRAARGHGEARRRVAASSTGQSCEFSHLCRTRPYQLLESGRFLQRARQPFMSSADTMSGLRWKRPVWVYEQKRTLSDPSSYSRSWIVGTWCSLSTNTSSTIWPPPHGKLNGRGSLRCGAMCRLSCAVAHGTKCAERLQCSFDVAHRELGRR